MFIFVRESVHAPLDMVSAVGMLISADRILNKLKKPQLKMYRL